MSRFNLFVLTPLLTLTLPALGHDGRRFEVKIVDNQLVTQGYLSDGSDDGGDNTLVNVNGTDLNYRNYYNAIHGHFSNSTIISDFASANLPGYDVLTNANDLIGSDLKMTITGFSKWTSPALSGPVTLSPLDPTEFIEVVYGGTIVNSQTFGTTPNDDTITLLASFNGGNGVDLDLSYDLTGDNPVGEIYVIESVLSTSAAGIADSSTVYTILSPDGTTPQEKLHHQSLHTERELGTPAPEPASIAMLALLPVLMRRRRG